jgi:hypothetical protein
MYKLQWAYIKDAKNNNIPVDKFKYYDTSYVYEDEEDAKQDRITLQAQCNDKYIRVVKA